MMAALINLFLFLVSMVLFLFPTSQWKTVGGKNYFFLPGVWAPLGISKSADFMLISPVQRGKIHQWNRVCSEEPIHVEVFQILGQQ